MLGYEVVFSSSLSLMKRVEGSVIADAKALRLADAVMLSPGCHFWGMTKTDVTNAQLEASLLRAHSGMLPLKSQWAAP